MANITIRHRAVALAQASDWCHADGTAAVRVHLLLTDPDPDGMVWAARGSSQLKPRPAQIVAQPGLINRLKRPTAFVLSRCALVQLHVSDVIRCIGELEKEHFDAAWDLLEQQTPAA